MDEAFQANCYYNIILQYRKNIKIYHDEMNYSSAFYSYTFNALVVATFMELAKIYDNHKSAINIIKLMDLCRENLSLFPKQKEVSINIEGEETMMKLPYEHEVKLDEYDFFQKEIESSKLFNKLFSDAEIPIKAEMTIERYFELYKWKYSKIKPKIENLRKQRNKIYAHNDPKSFENMEAIILDYPLKDSDVESLITFALEYCQFVIALLTGVNKASEPINIKDWQNTLKLVQIGSKYHKLEKDTVFIEKNCD